MIQNKRHGVGVLAEEPNAAELDLVVPFTTPELTRAALAAAGRMGAGLNAAIRLVKIQVVPYPLQLDESPVYIEFLKDQLARLGSDLPLIREIRLTRDFKDGLLGVLGGDSVVILAAPKRPWTTRNERLAAALRRAGHNVVLVPLTQEETVQEEAVHA